MEAFKQLSASHVSNTLRGEFHLKHLRYFQLLEAASGNSSVGDVREGVGLTNINLHARIRDRADPARGQLSTLRLDAGVNAEIRLSGVRHFTNSDCFVFCVSLQSPATATRIDTSYDACIRISDAYGLADRWRKSATVNGEALREADWTILADSVSYSWSENEFAQDGLASPDVFKKRKVYEFQHEFRVAVFPRREVDVDFITIVSPSCSELLEQVALPAPSKESDQHSYSIPEITDPDAELRRIKRIWDKEYEPFLRRHVAAQMRPQASDRAQWLNSLHAQCSELERAFDETYRQRVVQCIWHRRKRERSRRMDLRVVNGWSCRALFGAMISEGWISLFD